MLIRWSPMLFVMACGAPPSWVAEVDGTVVAFERQAMVAYMCGRGEGMADRTRWFRGDDPTSLLSQDGWMLDATTQSLESPDGSLELDELGGSFALYEGEPTDCTDGAIVWGPDPLSVQGAGCVTGSVFEVTPVGGLDILAPTLDVLILAPTTLERTLVRVDGL